MYASLYLVNTSTPTMMLGTNSTSNIVIDVTVGVITIILVAILTIVCVIVVYRKKRKLSVSYPVTHPTSGRYVLILIYSMYDYNLGSYN